jgi:hypothetical protein
MGFGNMSISRVDGAQAVRPRIAPLQNAEEQRVERVRPESGRRAGVEKSKGTVETRGAERTKLRSRSSEEGSLTLTTAEGDKVTISFRNQQSTKVDQATLYGPEGSYERTRVKTRESSQLSVSLEGELSEDELADITALVSKLSGGITSARGGDAEGAQAQISEPTDLGSIESYSFAYQQTSDYSFSDTRFRATRLSVSA